MAKINKALADQVRQLEEQLMQSGVGQSPHELAQLLADDFVEIGSSGRMFHKAEIIEALQNELPAELTLHDFRAVVLTENVILATHRSTRKAGHADPAVHSLRSSIWIKEADRWQMICHQGTRQSDP